MKKVKFGVVIFLLVITGCLTPRSNVLQPKWFNSDEFTGLLKIEKSEAVLDYDLDSSKGEVISFKSCAQVIRTRESQIVSHQYPLWQLLKINCTAVGYFIHAPEKSISYFPARFEKTWLQKLPANVVPNLGGNSIESTDKSLFDREPDMRIEILSDHSAELFMSGDLEATYIVLARGDFNDDGIEDLLLRIDWAITSAFGNGSELLMLSKSNDNLPIKITWRSIE